MQNPQASANIDRDRNPHLACMGPYELLALRLTTVGGATHVKSTGVLASDHQFISLPSQLVAFKALRARYFLLAVVCAMAWLYNLLATSSAGLNFRDTITKLQMSGVAYTFRLRCWTTINSDD